MTAVQFFARHARKLADRCSIMICGPYITASNIWSNTHYTVFVRMAADRRTIARILADAGAVVTVINQEED